MTIIEKNRQESNIGLSYATKKTDRLSQEIRQYLIFHEDDPNFPLEVILTEVPPYHDQPFHRHQTINEITIVLQGEAVGVTKEENGQEVEHPIKIMSLYDKLQETHYFKGIKAALDGTLLFVLEDKKTGEISGGELPYQEGFDAKEKYHTIKNPSADTSIIATVKYVDKKTMEQNPEIFKQDKIMFD
jgi:hypothetical protein